MKALPNILSVFRICLVPVFVIAYLLDDNDIRYFAVAVFVIANLSDMLDGIIARRLDAQSALGKFLDPLGDKLITLAALVCIASTKNVLIWAPCIFLIKEIFMGIGGLMIHKKAQIELPPANWLGKTATVVFFIVCLVLLIFGNFITDGIALALMGAAIALALAAFIKYLHMYVTIMKNRH